MTEQDTATTDVVATLGHLALGTRLKRLGERLQAETTRFIQAQGVDLPSSWFPLLAALDRRESTVGELAAALGVSQPGVTRSATNLARLRLVEIATGDTDRRRRTIRLTPEGAALVERARAELWPRIDAAVADACAGLDGPFLDQVGALERRLDEAPIDRRAAGSRP
ncbi:MarR family winged helix-turn-helix transcriptional regulator [Agromyces aurantiacus]|uniref:MarR family winged helix-turn-helix transcriptional regulator n=1 Tax=Agromyces aurantiacus TaxID=165814 RepID=A0ABV9R8E2_9MICO|nr:helix-turn-helix domain-containing protein [Agromyces aurantiacus]MBM7503085.1 DNA-binding MarR family transcriptional regulator [Agromyces aurantiacus]